MAVKTTQIDGDMSLGRNIAMGGKATIAGSTQIGQDLIVKGWLDAPNIKAANKGVFTSLEALEAAYPEPQDGWFAGIGDSTPFTAYTGQDGSWVATGGTIDINVDMTQYSEDLEQAQQDILAMEGDLSGKANDEEFQGFKEDVKDTYGELQENPEYLQATTDAADNLLYGVTEDGTFVAPKSQFVDKEAGKALIDSDYANGLSKIESPEFLEIYTDAEGNILYGVMEDGTFYCNGVPKDVAKAIADLKYYTDEKLKRNVITLQTSAFLTDTMLQPTDLSVPKMTATVNSQNVIAVSTKAELKAAITAYNTGSNDVIIVLQDDIVLDEALSITGKKYELTINGNGHKLINATTEYATSSYVGDKARSAYTGSVEDSPYVADNFDLLRLSRSPFYEAVSDVTDENGNTVTDGTDFTEPAGIRKFKLPSDFDGIAYDAETSGYQMFINFSTAWQSQTSPVTQIVEENDGTYLYFDYQGGYRCNYERESSHNALYTSFFLINCDQLPIYNIGVGKPISIKGGNIIYPSNYGKIYKCKSNVITVTNNYATESNVKVYGLVKITDLTIIGGNRVVSVADSHVIVEGCTIIGAQDRAIYASDSVDSKVYCLNNTFSTLQRNAILGDYASTIYATGNRTKDTGLDRRNDKAIVARGIYYIADNLIEDYGYSACGGGLTDYPTSQGSPVLINCYGIIENNVIRQTDEFVKYAKHRCLSDGGVIYEPTNNYPYTIVRYNKLINCYRRRGAMGIYLDDGAYNTYIFGNIVENCPSYAVYNRYANPQSALPYGVTANTNKVVLHNICDQAIMIQGNPNVADNGCYVGYNLITSAATMENSITNVMGAEEQLFSREVYLSDGNIKGVSKPQLWTNK